ncbi:MAG TPA: hypothetical protein VIK60_07740 [Vicinamibacterales bacterium]
MRWVDPVVGDRDAGVRDRLITGVLNRTRSGTIRLNAWPVAIATDAPISARPTTAIAVVRAIDSRTSPRLPARKLQGIPAVHPIAFAAIQRRASHA